MDMHSNDEQIREALAALAHGEEHPLADSIRRDPKLAARLAVLRAAVRSAGGRFYDAPEDLRQRVKAMMPVRRPTLLRTTLGMVGARSIAAPFQSVLQLGDTELRLLYSPEAEGWSVMGDAGHPDLKVEADSEVEYEGPGRFRFRCAHLEDSDFTARFGEERWAVPAPIEP